MEDDTPTPPTESYGALVPPRKVPPTALALASAPLPNRRPSTPAMYDITPFQQFLSKAFDMVDGFADTVAEGLGLRGK